MLVSAVIADGPPRRVLESVVDGHVTLVLPEPAARELHRVLIEKIGLDERAVAGVLSLLHQLADQPAPVPEDVPRRSGDPDGDRIIAAALAAGADVLVSGDRKNVLPLVQVETMRILRPQELLAEIAD